jgi:DNA-binding transcriptional LysR family regulator
MAQSANDIRDALGATSLNGGTVRVSCSRVAATYLLPPILVEFHKAAPAIQVELVSTNEVSSLHRRDADIALRFMRPDQETLIGRKVGEVKMGAYAARAYLGRRRPPESIHELAQHTLVGLDRDVSQLMAVREAGLALERKSIAFRTDDQVALIELIARGAGIGFMPQFVAAQLQGLRQVLRDVPMPRLPGWLVVHREIASNPAIRALYDHLASAIGEVLARN